DVETRPLRQRCDRGLRGQLDAGFTQLCVRFPIGIQISDGRAGRALHPRKTRVDTALALVVEDTEVVGDGREPLVDGVASEQETMLRARGEHAVRLLGAERD